MVHVCLPDMCTALFRLHIHQREMNMALAPSFVYHPSDFKPFASASSDPHMCNLYVREDCITGRGKHNSLSRGASAGGSLSLHER